MSRNDQYENNVARLNAAPTEDSLALSFCSARPELRYVAAWNRWMTWDGTVWSEDSTLAVYDLVRAHIRTCTDESKMLRANVVAAVERMARADRRFAATVDQWDADDWVLNTPSGIIDLRSGHVRVNDMHAYLSKMTPIAPGGDCPRWLLFLAEVTDGDSEYQTFLQRVAGYTALGTIREHALFFAHGGGGNGKGIFLNTLRNVLGDYAAIASMDTFVDSHNDRHPADLAMLRGARLVVAQETEEGRAWAESRIKALTGGDPVTARFMRQDFFTYQPKFKLLIAGNHKPRLRNVDEAMRRRLHLLPFTVTFDERTRDPDLSEKLSGEREGILAWVIEGAARYLDEGLSPPQIVQDATAQYFATENTFAQWLADRCDLGERNFETPTQLYEDWQSYAKGSGEEAGPQKAFGQRLESAGFERGNLKSKGGRFWNGLQLKVKQEPH